MKWLDVCENRNLQDLPFKIELNREGKIVMSPVKVYHSVSQGEIAALLRLHRKDGRILTECAIHTRSGTKVANVAWASKQCYSVIKDEVECSIAPEVCIEILSSSNTGSEMEEKRALYFECGAREVWICDEHGRIEFFTPQRQVERSDLFAGFAGSIDIAWSFRACRPRPPSITTQCG